MANLDVYIKKGALRVDNRSMGWSILSKAPNWKVKVFSCKERTVCDTTIERLEKFGLGFYPEKVPHLTCKRAAQFKKENVFNVKCTHYVIPIHARVDFANSPISTANANHPVMLQARFCHLLLADFPGFPPQPGELLAAIYGIPSGEGLPLKYSVEFEQARHVTQLNTRQCVRKPLPPSLFLLPTGLKQESSVTEILAPHANLKILEDVFPSTVY